VRQPSIGWVFKKHGVTFVFVLLPSKSDPEQPHSTLGYSSIQKSLVPAVTFFTSVSTIGRKDGCQIVVGPRPDF
jgi:hypothetical protein